MTTNSRSRNSIVATETVTADRCYANKAKLNIDGRDATICFRIQVSRPQHFQHVKMRFDSQAVVSRKALL